MRIALFISLLISYQCIAQSRPQIEWSIAFNPGTSGNHVKSIKFSPQNPDIVFISGETSSAFKPYEDAERQKKYPYKKIIPEGALETDETYDLPGLYIAKINHKTSTIEFFTILAFDFAPTINAIELDSEGYIYIVGSRQRRIESKNYIPIKNKLEGHYEPTSDFERDGLFIKLSPDAEEVLIHSYIGGSGRDSIEDIAILPNGNFILAGSTSSEDFPIKSAAQGNFGGVKDGFYSLYSADGTLLSSTYLGGSQSDGISAIEVTTQNEIVLAGGTYSSDIQVSINAYQTYLNGELDAILAKVSPESGEILYTTYFGGSHKESASDIESDADGNLYIVGTSGSPDYPIVGNNAIYPKNSIGAVTTKFNPELNKVLFSSYHSNALSRLHRASSLAVNEEGDIAFVGSVMDPENFETTNPLQEIDSIQYDPRVIDEEIFIIKWLNLSDGYTLDYATLLGGRAYSNGGDRLSIDLKGRSEVAIGGKLSSNEFIDDTYHYEDYNGTSGGPFAIMLSNEVDDRSQIQTTSDTPTETVKTDSSSNSGGGGSVSLLFLALLILTRILSKGANKQQT